MGSLAHLFTGWYDGLKIPEQDIFKATIGPTVAIFLFAATNILQIYFNRRTRKNNTKHVIIGIFKEIGDNLNYARKVEKTNAAKEMIKKRIIDEDRIAVLQGKTSIYRPLVGITESSNFYDAVAATVPSIRSTCLVSITDYYRSVMDQKQVADVINSDAFLCITVDSRCEIIDELWTAFSDSSTKASVCLRNLDRAYPKRWFRQLGLDDITN